MIVTESAGTYATATSLTAETSAFYLKSHTAICQLVWFSVNKPRRQNKARDLLKAK